MHLAQESGGWAKYNFTRGVETDLGNVETDGRSQKRFIDAVFSRGVGILESSPIIDFSSNSKIVWAVAEGERLTYGHLINPTFATETSLIEPLPHRRLAVYEYLLKQPRLRFLLADDTGAGKTIMTGLYIQELLSRRLIRRVFIVPPARLVGNWEREMKHCTACDQCRVVHSLSFSMFYQKAFKCFEIIGIMKWNLHASTDGKVFSSSPPKA